MTHTHHRTNHKDLIKGARQILQPAQFQQFGTMEEAKDELMAMERVLLQTIKFDFNIEHAHKFIIQVVRQAPTVHGPNCPWTHSYFNHWVIRF